TQPPPRPTLFPYTTLFRSRSSPNVVYATIETKVTGNAAAQGNTEASVYRSDDRGGSWQKTGTAFSYPWYMGQIRVDPTNPERVRSEEHTSELQSLAYLVCR